MPRGRLFDEARRVNIIIERAMHESAVARARDYGFRGGFSEYVSRLIAADTKRKGRAVMNAAPLKRR